MSIPSIRLERGRAERVRSGHPWVFSNEIAGAVRDLPEGGTVDVLDHRGAFLGRGHANPSSLIAVRLLSRRKREDIDHPAFLAHRIREAIAYRQTVQPGRRSLRLVHGEADGLPGLHVDRYGDVLAVNLTTAGMEARRDVLRGALREVLEPGAAVLRCDGIEREREGLDPEHGAWFGEIPDHVDIDEHGVRFRVRPLQGQGSPHFYDQATNRARAASLCADRRVLDVYSHDGAWALHALVGGARAAIAVDRAQDACERAQVNGDLNGVGDRLLILKDEGKRTLQGLLDAQERFGAVMVDPPPFATSKKAVPGALEGYRDLNRIALALVEPGGLLFTSSHSRPVGEGPFVEALHQAASEIGRRLRIAHRGEQAPDHPIDPVLRESRFLIHFALVVDLQA